MSLQALRKTETHLIYRDTGILNNMFTNMELFVVQMMILSRTEEPAKASICARDRHALQ